MSLEHDHLLSWLSARGTAPTEAVKEACKVLAARRTGAGQRALDPAAEHVGSPWMELLEPLRRLGHVERDQLRRGWRVVTPTLLWRGKHDGRGLVCGARDHELASKLSAQLGARFERTPGGNGPERWCLRGDSGEMRRLAKVLGLRWVPDRIEALFAALPSAEEAIRALPEEDHLVSAFRRRRWERYTLSGARPAWRPVQSERYRESRSLMRSREAGQPEWWLWIEEGGVTIACERASALAEVRVRRLKSFEHRRLARWLVIVEANLPLAWSATSQQLEVPWFRGAPLPHLIDRGLCLLTGHCPESLTNESASATATYEGVSRTIAESVASILGIPLLERS